MGIVQTFDVSMNIAPSSEPTLPEVVYDGFKIKSVEVERVYAAGGSTATVELVYTEDVEPGTIAQIAERAHQPDMEIRVEQSHHEPKSEQPPVPESAEDLSSTHGLLSDILEGDALTDVFGEEIVSNIVPEPLLGTAEPRSQATIQSKRQTVFTGKPIRVVGKQDGVIEVKLIDNRLVLNRNYVNLDTFSPDGATTREIASNLLNEELGFVEMTAAEYDALKEGNSPDSVNADSPREVQAVVISEEITDEPLGLRYGFEEPMTLFRALTDLATRTATHFWIDRYNNFRFEIYPDKKQFVPVYVTDVEAGNEEDPSNVLVKSPFDDTGLELFGGTSSENVNFALDAFDEDEREERTLSQSNISSAQEVESHALSGHMTDQLSRDYGKITMLGTPSLSVYDGIVLGILPDLAPINNGLYASKVVRHRINGSDGFVTEVELGESVAKMYNRLEGASQEAAKRSKGVEEQRNVLELDAEAKKSTFKLVVRLASRVI